jgi:hypothetical protein
MCKDLCHMPPATAFPFPFIHLWWCDSPNFFIKPCKLPDFQMIQEVKLFTKPNNYDYWTFPYNK